MLFLAVNFHYIHQEDKYPFPGIYSTPVEKFSDQLELLGQHFDFISQLDLIEAVEKNKNLPLRSCLITFDDGLKSQYENALPILKEKAVPALFFVNTLPIKEQRVCLVHKIHWLRAHLPLEKFLAKLDENLKKILGKKLEDFPITKEIIRLKYPYDSLNIARLKFSLNYIIPVQYREKIIDNIFREVVNDESDFCQKFYMSEKEIKHLAELSFLGTHSKTHMPFSQLSETEISEDIKNSLKVLSQITGNKKIISISYPYGDIGDVSQLVRTCESLGLKLGFTTERSFNGNLHHPLLFARMDGNDVSGGKSARFAFEDDNIKIFDDKITLSRQLYFKD